MEQPCTSPSTRSSGTCAGSSWPARRCRTTSAWEEAGIVDREVWRKAGAAGLLGMDVDQEYGGGGQRDFRFNAVLVEEIVARRLLRASASACTTTSSRRT